MSTTTSLALVAAAATLAGAGGGAAWWAGETTAHQAVHCRLVPPGSREASGPDWRNALRGGASTEVDISRLSPAGWERSDVPTAAALRGRWAALDLAVVLHSSRPAGAGRSTSAAAQVHSRS
jgi:hypothetical protein